MADPRKSKSPTLGGIQFDDDDDDEYADRDSDEGAEDGGPSRATTGPATSLFSSLALLPEPPALEALRVDGYDLEQQLSSLEARLTQLFREGREAQEQAEELNEQLKSLLASEGKTKKAKGVKDSRDAAAARANSTRGEWERMRGVRARVAVDLEEHTRRYHREVRRERQARAFANAARSLGVPTPTLTAPRTQVTRSSATPATRESAPPIQRQSAPTTPRPSVPPATVIPSTPLASPGVGDKRERASTVGSTGVPETKRAKSASRFDPSMVPDALQEPNPCGNCKEGGRDCYRVPSSKNCAWCKHNRKRCTGACWSLIEIELGVELDSRNACADWKGIEESSYNSVDTCCGREEGT